MTAAVMIIASGAEISLPRAAGVHLALRWSKDGGHSWSSEHLLQAGKIGEYKYRARMLRMGVARDMVFEISMTDPVPWRIIDAYLYTSPGTRAVPPAASERLANELLKVQ